MGEGVELFCMKMNGRAQICSRGVFRAQQTLPMTTGEQLALSTFHATPAMATRVQL